MQVRRPEPFQMLVNLPFIRRFVQGSDAHGAGVQFPNDEDTLSRTLLVGNVSHQINSDQVHSMRFTHQTFHSL